MKENKYLLKMVFKVIFSIALIAFITGIVTQITDNSVFVIVLPIAFVIIALVVSNIVV